MDGKDLTNTTKTHYENLIRNVGERYIHYRWCDHPVKRSHYRQTRHAIELIFQDYVGQVEELLEVGCGPAVWTPICLKYAYSLTLFDISFEMLKVAKERLANCKQPINFIQGDFVEESDKITRKFDVVFSARALEYMSDKKRMVKNSYNLLKERGTLIVITKNPSWRDKTKYSSERTELLQSGWISRKELEQCFTECGFGDLKIRSVVLGSYYFPFNNRVGTLCLEIVNRVLGRNEMMKKLDPLTESYLMCGRKM